MGLWGGVSFSGRTKIQAHSLSCVLCGDARFDKNKRHQRAGKAKAGRYFHNGGLHRDKAVMVGFYNGRFIFWLDSWGTWALLALVA